MAHRTRHSNTQFAALALLAGGVLAGALLGDAGAMDGHQGQQDAKQQGNRQAPPARKQIGGSRTSSKWIKLKNGASVAVDDGLDADGVRVYMALTYRLVAVDANDDTKVLWNKFSGAFWDEYSLEKIEVDGQDEKVWTVALRSQDHQEYVDYLDLHTGELVKRVGEAADPGKPVELRNAWCGSGAKDDSPVYAIAATEAEWQAIYDKLWAGLDTRAKAVKDVDFSQEALLIYYTGKGTNCSGYDDGGAFESDDAFTIRLEAYTYQSDGNPPPEWPYGIIVVPRMTEKPYVIETNRQSLIGGPPMWKEARRFDPLK